MSSVVMMSSPSEELREGVLAAREYFAKFESKNPKLKIALDARRLPNGDLNEAGSTILAQSYGVFVAGDRTRKRENRLVIDHFRGVAKNGGHYVVGMVHDGIEDPLDAYAKSLPHSLSKNEFRQRCDDYYEESFRILREEWGMPEGYLTSTRLLSSRVLGREKAVVKLLKGSYLIPFQEISKDKAALYTKKDGDLPENMPTAVGENVVLYPVGWAYLQAVHDGKIEAGSSIERFAFENVEHVSARTRSAPSEVEEILKKDFASNGSAQILTFPVRRSTLAGRSLQWAGQATKQAMRAFASLII